MSNPNDNRTASQRIDDLERGMISMYQAFEGVLKDLNTTKEAVKLLGNKAESIAMALRGGEQPTDEVIARLMTQNNVAELKGRVDQLVANGGLVATDVVADHTFVVGRELTSDGAIANPRLQFVLAALAPEIREKLQGAKVGQVISFQEGKLTFEVQEIYLIPSPAPQGQQEAAPASAEASEAPSASADGGSQDEASNSGTAE